MKNNFFYRATLIQYNLCYKFIKYLFNICHLLLFMAQIKFLPPRLFILTIKIFAEVWNYNNNKIFNYIYEDEIIMICKIYEVDCCNYGRPYRNLTQSRPAYLGSLVTAHFLSTHTLSLRYFLSILYFPLTFFFLLNGALIHVWKSNDTFSERN